MSACIKSIEPFRTATASALMTSMHTLSRRGHGSKEKGVVVDPVEEVEEEQEEEEDNDESDEVKFIESKSASTKMSFGSHTTRSGAAFSMSGLPSYAKNAKVKTEGFPPNPKKALETKGAKEKVADLKMKDVGSVTRKRKASVLKKGNVFEGLEVDDIGGKIVPQVSEGTWEIMKEACAALMAERDALKERAETAEKEVDRVKREKIRSEDKLTSKIDKLEKDLKESKAKMSRFEENHSQELERTLLRRLWCRRGFI